MSSKLGYKKYMKKKTKKDNSLLGIFLVSFFGMLLIFTFVIKSFLPTVDTTIGDFAQEPEIEIPEPKKIVDERLTDIQNEDQGHSFSEMMAQAEQTTKSDNADEVVDEESNSKEEASTDEITQSEPVYKVFIGNYTSLEQARVAKDIIQESNSGLNPIVKCLGSNSFTLQVGIFKNKQSAESLLYVVQHNHLPGRIVQDY